MTADLWPALPGPLVLVGCGKMGGALLKGWLDCGLAPGDALVVEPQATPATAEAAARGVRVVAGFDALPALTAAALVLAIKPQMMAAVLPRAAALAGPQTLVLSIAAGIRLATLEAAFGAGQPVVRAMPNTPAAVGCGMTALVAAAATPDRARAVAERLCAAVGATAWVGAESEIDIVTALSGGGPAYVFLLIEALAKAGAAAGLDPALAMTLARETVIGAGLLARQSDEAAAQLRRNVTSPGGTTERALAVLMAPDGLQPLFDRAIAAATARARELSGL